MNSNQYLAFDLGAGSGRAIAGTYSNGKVRLQEISRFSSEMINVLGHYHWDIYRLYDLLKDSLKTVALKSDFNPVSIGIDTWGVDYGLLAEDGSILEIPYAYRDSRTDGAMEQFFKLIPREKVYQLTGIQFMQLNTLFQLYAAKRDNLSIMKIATDLLFIPDLLNYLFTGKKTSEFTFATTSQLFNPIKMAWEGELFDALGISMSIMQKIVMPGTIISELSGNICQETGINGIPVIAVALHDTGSAIAAVPAEGKNWAYLSSGTWSLMGIELDKPLISEKTQALNFTNEGGVEGTFRFLKNITGLWLLQQSKKEWATKKDYSYEELVEMAKKQKPFRCFVDSDARELMNPINMPDEIRVYCKRTGQYVPQNEGEIVRCIFDSLAFKYRNVFDQLKQVSPFPIEKLYVIGGGSKNQFLCQLTANAIGIPVVAGPAEATAYGNIMVQAMAMGHVKSLSQIREVIRNSVECVTFYPEETSIWENAYINYMTVVNY